MMHRLALGQHVTAIHQRTRVHSDESWTTYEYALLVNGSWANRGAVQTLAEQGQVAGR